MLTRAAIVVLAMAVTLAVPLAAHDAPSPAQIQRAIALYEGGDCAGADGVPCNGDDGDARDCLIARPYVCASEDCQTDIKIKVDNEDDHHHKKRRRW